MRTAYKCRAYPGPEQAAQLGRTFGCVCLVWNKTLQARQHRYHTEGRSTSYKETDANLAAWKKTEDLGFLSEVSSVPLRHQLHRVRAFFAGRAKYPRFKSRNGRQSAHYTRSAFTLRDGRLRLAKRTAPLRFVWSWPGLDPVELNPTMVVISREPDGRWYVAFAVDTAAPEPAPRTGEVLGVDLGVAHFATLSTGETIANRKHLDRKARNARADFLHRTTTNLLRRADTIAIEDLNVTGMIASARGTVDNPGTSVAAKAGLNRSVSDAAFGEFRRQWEYKAERAAKPWSRSTGGTPPPRRARTAGTSWPI